VKAEVNLEGDCQSFVGSDCSRTLGLAEPEMSGEVDFGGVFEALANPAAAIGYLNDKDKLDNI
jgi:hypothetical protein